MSIPFQQVYRQGMGSVSSDAMNSFIQAATTAAQLRAFPALPGMTAVTQGSASVNDGKGAFYWWNGSGTLPDDSYNAITPPGGGAGQWQRLNLNYSQVQYTVINFGADPTGVNDSTAAFQTALNLGGCLFVPPGTYLLGALNMSVQNTQMIGFGRPTLKVRDGVSTDFVTCSAHGCQITGFTFLGHSGSVYNSPPSEQLLVEATINAGQSPINDFHINDCMFFGGTSALRVQAGVRYIIRDIVIFQPYQWGCITDDGAEYGIIDGISVFQSGTNEGIKHGFGGTSQEVLNLRITNFLLYECGRFAADPGSGFTAYQEGIDIYAGPTNTIQISNGQIIRCGGGGIECKTTTPEPSFDPNMGIQYITVSDVIIEVDLPSASGLNFHWGTGASSGYPFVPTPPQSNMLGNVKFKDCELRYVGTQQPENQAIVLFGWTFVTITDCDILNYQNAINLDGGGSTDATVRDIWIKGGTVRGVQFGLEFASGTLDTMTMTNWDCVATVCPLQIGGGAGPSPQAITAITNNGGQIQLTVPNHGAYTGELSQINSVTGTTEANGWWTVTVLDANNLILNGPTYVNAWTGGGYFNISGGLSQNVTISNCQLITQNSINNQAAVTITGASNNGSGLIRITAPSHGYSGSGITVAISGVTGTVEANGYWLINVIDSNTFDLVGSTFVNTYISGGNSHPPTLAAVNLQTVSNFKMNGSTVVGLPNGVRVIVQSITNGATSTGGALWNNSITSLSSYPMRLDEGNWNIWDNSAFGPSSVAGWHTAGTNTIQAARTFRGYATTLPTGQGNYGDYYENSAPSAGGALRWVSVGYGTTWKALNLAS